MASEARAQLTQMRVAWLTKAVRALMKMEFDGKEGRTDYSTMAVGMQDLELSRLEADRDASEQNAKKFFEAFVKEPNDTKAQQMVEEAMKKGKI